MFDRLKAAIATAVGRGETETSPETPTSIPAADLVEVDFRSLDPGSLSEAGTEPLRCPVTRQELMRADKLFQCRVCRTTYSAPGWRFLQDVDRGRCCACRSRKTVFPLD
jgi:hypothetical protein